MKPYAIVVDDDAAARHRLECALRGLGLAVLGEPDAADPSALRPVEAVTEACRQQGRPVSLVILGDEHAERSLEIGVGLTLEEMERRLILLTLEKTGWNRTRAAGILGVTPRTLSNKLKIWRTRGLVAHETR